jgi:hypothetical protein
MFDPFTLRELIKEHGVTITLKRYSGGTYDPATGSITPSYSAEVVKVYFFNADPSFVESNTVSMGERRAVISDKLENGSNTPDLKAGDILSGFGDDAIITRASKITSSTSNMCQLVYLKE